MIAKRLLVAGLLALGAAQQVEAQRLAPLAPVATSSPSEMEIVPVGIAEHADAPIALRRASRDTLPTPRALSRTGAMIGGIGGAVAGALLGTAIGAGTAQGCHGEFCGLAEAALGFAMGESLGLAVGTHLGSGSREHGNIVLTTLTSAVILVGGTMLGASAGRAGVIMVPLTPALQLMSVWAIENR